MLSDDLGEDATQPLPPPTPGWGRGSGNSGRIGQMFGGYEIVSELGRGGMGIVYRARQLQLNRTVALKMLTGHFGGEELIRFISEAKTVAQLHHANIVHIYEVGQTESVPYFSMEYIEAGTLTERMRQRPFTPREAAELLLPVARAVHFAHEQGIIHRDLKPGNILLDADGVPKVVDFGIAKRLHDDTSLTLSGVVVGTPTYMAPEQAKGTSRDVGPAADVYSLGAILYEMLTGRPPFLPDESDTALALRVITEDPVSPAWHRPDIPRELEAICMVCLQKEPKDRFPSALTLAEDLRRYLSDEPILAKPPTRIRRTVKWVRRHPWRTVMYATLLVLLGAGLQRLWNWEMHERAHVIYAGGIDMIQGVAQPTGVLSEAQRSKRSVSYRLTRQGRAGKITRVEVVNPRGHPAVVRRLMGGDALPLVLQGSSGAQSPDERTPEAVAAKFTYADDRVMEITGLDRNAQVQWRVQYDHATSDGRFATARFTRTRGFETVIKQGASHAQFQRDEHGREVRTLFFNSRGKRAQNGEGVYGYVYERNATGAVTRFTNLDASNQPMANRIGEIVKVFSYNELGQVVRAETRDAKDQPMDINGIASIVTRYDPEGNLIRVENHDARDNLVKSRANEIAAITYQRNERGELVESDLLTLQADGTLTPLVRKFISYDEYGHPSDIRVTSAQSWRASYTNDAQGNILKSQWLTADGQPTNGYEGWSMVKYDRGSTSSPPGWREEETYFDTTGGKSYAPGGQHRRIAEYDLDGTTVRLVNEDFNESITAFYRYVSAPEFDQSNSLIRTVARFEDKDGKLVTGPNVYSGVETEFDEEGRAVKSWQIGSDVPISEAPIWLTETVWRIGSVKRKEVKQACDENRKPLGVTATGTPARVEQIFDEFGGNLARQLESGFLPEVGFTERELVIGADGRLASVTRRRKDGTVVPESQIEVRVRKILDGAPQTSYRLHVGDTVLVVNGRPVNSMYMFGDGKGANGGEVEVLRSGQKLRFENFSPGPLGVLMEEIAK